MRISDSFDYRNARAILEHEYPILVSEIDNTLKDPNRHLIVGASTPSGQQDLSRQIQSFFPSGWQAEQPTFSLPDLRYDLLKVKVPIEIEVSHQRLVYADFFKFLVDYSNREIPAGVMVTASDPNLFGHDWHNSCKSTRAKIEAVSKNLLVPILVLGIEP